MAAALLKSGPYRGWWVVLGGFLAALFATGISRASFGLFLVPAIVELNVSRADANTLPIVVGIGSAVLAPIAGRLVDRYSVSLIMGIGGVLLALALVGISMTSSPWVMILLAVGPIAFASDCAGGLAANAVTARWFRRRRGRALGFMGIFASGGSFIVAPIAGYLIVHYGWRNALAALGILGGIVIILAAIFLIHPRPTEQQLRESGELEENVSEAANQQEQRIWTYRELLTSRNFLLLVFGGGLLISSDQAILVSLPSYLKDRSIGLQEAAFMVSVLGGSGVVGKLIVGYLADLVDPRKLFLVVAALHLLLLTMFLVEPSYTIMMLICSVVGVGIGGVLPVQQVLNASIFGSASFGTVLGTAAVIVQPLMIAGLRFIGEVRDRTGSYQLAFQVFIGVVLLAAFLVWQLPRKQPAHRAGDIPAPAQGMGAVGAAASE